MKAPVGFIVIIRDEGGTEIEIEEKELIVCKNCKHWDGYYCHNKWYGNGYASYSPPIKSEDGFCDWAERREK